MEAFDSELGQSYSCFKIGEFIGLYHRRTGEFICGKLQKIILSGEESVGRIKFKWGPKIIINGEGYSLDDFRSNCKINGEGSDRHLVVY